MDIIAMILFILNTIGFFSTDNKEIKGFCASVAVLLLLLVTGVI